MMWTGKTRNVIVLDWKIYQREKILLYVHDMFSQPCFCYSESTIDILTLHTSVEELLPFPGLTFSCESEC